MVEENNAVVEPVETTRRFYMKKNNCFINILILIFSLAAFSCSNMFDQKLTKPAETSDEAYIILSVNAANARTVLPQADIDDLQHVELYGRKTGEQERLLGSWDTVKAMREATPAMGISTGSWTFRLEAKKNSQFLYGLSFSDTVNKEIIPGENELSFVLSMESLGDGLGSFEITLNYAATPGADKVTKAVAALEAMFGTDDPEINSQALVPSDGIVSYSVSDIHSGSYRAKIVLYTVVDNVDLELATYCEIVQVASTCPSKATRTIESFDNLYTVAYNLNGGTLPDGITLPETVTRKSSAISLPDLSRDYYTFNGWYTDENFAAGTKVTSLSNFADGVNVYASFTPITYTITYELNGGTNPAGVVTSYTAEEGVTLPVPENEGKPFYGWYLTPDFSGDEVTSWVSGISYGNITLYANWTVNIATAENIVEKILAMTESGTIKAKGEFSKDLIRQINNALHQVYHTYVYDVLIGLDLSEVTGLTSIEYTKDGVNTYTERAFYGCQNLSSIVLPNTITGIGRGAFYDCQKLKSITIGDAVTYIGEECFGGCYSLEEMTLPFVGTTGTPEDYSKEYLFGYIFGSKYFTGATKITQNFKPTASSGYSASYYIPDSIKKVTVLGGKISYGAFYGCTKLNTIILGDGVTGVSTYAFYNCSGIKNLSLGNGITYIGEKAFYNCTGLTEVVVGDSVTSIGAGAFSGCSSLKEITIPFVGGSKNAQTASSSTVFGYIFGSTSYTGGTATKQTYSSTVSSTSGTATNYIPDVLRKVTVTGGKILYGAFHSCTRLTSIILSEDIDTIDDYAFYSCAYITEMSIGDNVKRLGECAFYGCNRITNLSLGNGLEHIDYGCFWGCIGLESVTLPPNIKKIGKYAFKECSNLAEVTFANTDDWLYWKWTNNSNYTGGGSVDIFSPTKNATQFKKTYVEQYWYLAK